MLAAAQWGEVRHRALAVHARRDSHVPALLSLDREHGILHQEQHRCISSPSQTDPPLCSPRLY